MRENEGSTIYGVSKLTGVAPSTIYLIEQGGSHEKSMEKVATYFGYTLQEIAVLGFQAEHCHQERTREMFPKLAGFQLDHVCTVLRLKRLSTPPAT